MLEAATTPSARALREEAGGLKSRNWKERPAVPRRRLVPVPGRVAGAGRGHNVAGSGSAKQNIKKQIQRLVLTAARMNAERRHK